MKSRLLSSLIPAIKTTVLIIGLVYVILFSNSVPGWFNPILIGLAVLFWLIFNRAETGLEIPVLIFFAALIFTTFFSVDTYRSMDQVYRLSVGFLVLFLSAGLVQRFVTPERIIAVLLLVGGLAMLWSWLDFARWYAGWLAVEPGHWIPEIGFRLDGSNNLAAYYNLLLMIALAFILISRRKWIRIFSGIYALSALILIFLTTSRGGWVGTAAGLAIIFLLLFVKGRTQIRGLWISIKKKRVLLLGLAGIVGVCLVAAGFLALRLLNNPTHGDFLISRSDFWPVALSMFADSPLLGKGLATYPSFRLQAFSFPPSPFFLHAHNQYLDILAGSGLIGFAAFGYLLVGFIRAFWSKLRVLLNDLSPVVIGAAAGLTTFLVHGIFDGLYRMSFASLTLVVLLGAALSRPIPKQRSGLRKTMLASFALVVVGYGLWNAWGLEPLEQGVQDANDPPAAVINFDEAVRRLPNLAIAFQQQGLAYSNLTAGRPDTLQEANAAFSQAVKMDPSWGANSANLGALYLASGDLADAEKYLQQAVAAAPESALFYLNLGVVEEARGNFSWASTAYSQALKLAPEYAPAYFWRSNPFRSSVLASMQPTEPASPVTLPEMESRIVNGQTRAIDYTSLAALQLQAGQIQAAQKSMSMAHFAYLDNDSEQLEIDWQDAEIAAATGDLEKAVVTGESILNNLVKQGVAGPNSYGRVQYAEQVFNVPAMPQDLVPQLTFIAINDQWGTRMMKVYQWAEALGQPERASRIKETILHYVPDFETLLLNEKIGTLP
jgi:O-antigen ligase/tetratricopeptide (TPR) repeat protein